MKISISNQIQLSSEFCYNIINQIVRETKYEVLFTNNQNIIKFRVGNWSSSLRYDLECSLKSINNGITQMVITAYSLEPSTFFHVVAQGFIEGVMEMDVPSETEIPEFLEREARRFLRLFQAKADTLFPAQNTDQHLPIKILFLASDPEDAQKLRLGQEFRDIQEQLKLSKFRDYFRMELPQLSIRPLDISQALLDTQPHIVHFSGHGTSKGALCFENIVGETHFVQPNSLAALFEQFSTQVNCVILNACYSEIQAHAIAKHINYVIGMNQSIGDKAAIAFAVGFYQALGAGRSVEDAYKLGCVQVRLQNIPEHLTPVLIKKNR
jgi:hypothetical protein